MFLFRCGIETVAIGFFHSSHGSVYFVALLWVLKFRIPSHPKGRSFRPIFLMKRLILAVITLISLIPFFLSLARSLGEPQVQSYLELSQTDLVLMATEGRGTKTDWIQPDWFVLGQDPYAAAREQYENSLQTSTQNLAKLQENLTQLQAQEATQSLAKGLVVTPSPQQTAIAALTQQETLHQQQLKLKLGLLEIAVNQPEKAIQQWQAVGQTGDVTFPPGSPAQTKLPALRETAQALTQLWQDPPPVASQVEPQSAQLFQTHLTGWFRDRALARLYTVTQQAIALETLQQGQQQQAAQALQKLTLLSVLPIVGGSLGLGLIVVLLLERVLKKENALLATGSQTPWSTPWDWEVTWQVLAVGFLFLGQIGLPIVLGMVPFNASQLSLRGKAFYVLVSYGAMTLGGLTVMYLSIKPYFPLPQDWFRFRWRLPDWGWGLGGYFVALPLVVLISLLNQQLWQGQGGSNPLLLLALQAQDKWVLGIFFFTAVVMAPFFEEMMFRGFLLASLTRYCSVNVAILLSSFLFAIAHLNLSEVLPLAGLGMILGIVYTRTRNLWVPMLLHGLWNSGTLISLFILGSST